MTTAAKDMADLHRLHGRENLMATIEAGLEEVVQNVQEVGRSESNQVVTLTPAFIDLGALVRAGLPRELPRVAPCFEGQCLLYASRLNEIHAEPSVGKTNVGCAMAVAEISVGGMVLFLDPEDTPYGIAAKLTSFGLTSEQLSAQFRYVHNPSPQDYAAAQLWAASNPCALVICDGLAEALAAEGLNEDVPGDVLPFFRNRLRPFAETGAAVLVSDHVAKNAETRGRWARGSGAKLGRYDGAVYALNLGEGYTRDKAGFVKLVVAKDRVGGIGIAGQTVAELHFTPEDGQTSIEWKRPESTSAFKPTELMRKIVDYLTHSPDASLTQLRTLGKGEYVDKAIGCLVEDGKLRVEKLGPGKGTKHHLLP